MSNPEPDFRRSSRRHRGPIRGLVAIGLFVTLLTTAYVLWWGVEEIDPQPEVAPLDRIDGEIMGTVPAEPLNIDRDQTPGPVGVAPDAPGVDVERQDGVD